MQQQQNSFRTRNETTDALMANHRTSVGVCRELDFTWYCQVYVQPGFFTGVPRVRNGSKHKLRSVVAYPNPLHERISILFLYVSINIGRRMRGGAYVPGQDVLRNEECRNMKRRVEIYTV